MSNKIFLLGFNLSDGVYIRRILIVESGGKFMLKRLLQILCLLPIFAAGSAYAITCQSNEFEYNGECIENKFQITTTNDTNKFVFNMSAQGTFYIDWGDGNVQMINRTGTTMTEYSHNYASTNEYIIKFGGRATGYSTVDDTTYYRRGACILFGDPGNSGIAVNNTKTKLAGISGSLGALFPTIGNGGTKASQPRFMATFIGCSNLTSSIPSDLFLGVKGTGIPHMFTYTFYRCSGLSNTNIDDPDNSGKKYAFPPNLFSGLSSMSGAAFYGTFYGCSGLTGTIPGTLFNIEKIKPDQSAFHSTFYGCSGLTGSIPDGLFAHVSGKAGSYLFYQTFLNCSGLTGSIPDNLFGGITSISGAAAPFQGTFSGCSGLTGAIPATLFSGISGTPASYAFRGTFYGCTGLTGTDIDDPNNPGMKYALPPTLFSGLSGRPGTYVFYETFSDCTGLAGTIPGGLFSFISGAPQTYMFYKTFFNCSGLTGPIPGNLFAGISGTPSTSIFQYTFAYCTGLSETDIDDPDNPGMKYAIPPNLFAGISGKPASAMFAQTFAGMSGLKGTIPKDLFKNISGAPAASMFITLFAGCTGLKGSIPGTLFAGISGAPATGMFKTTFNGCNHLTGAIPADLFSGISGAPASEMFYQTFLNCSGLTGPIPGDLFSGVSGAPASHMFYETFAVCSGLGGTDIDDPDQPGYKYAIPPTLFSGISGAPAQSMFNKTFRACSKLTGSIPGSLFSGISGKPTTQMFEATFFGCSGLTGSIPEGLFGSLSGAPAYAMFNQTFRNCTNLTEPIPGNLFADIGGKPAQYMFYITFAGCTNLGKNAVGGTSTYYVPPELFAGIDTSTTAPDMMTNVFNGSGLRTSCPAGTTQYTTGFESYFSGKKSCTQCSAEYPLYDSTNDTCYAQVTFIDSDNNTLLKKEDVYYDGNNGSGYNLPSYSPVKPDTILTNWENGSGTVIAANDVLTGNQVVYSDWGFHCDSGKYFHLGNSSQICAAETKRTDHALVINVDPEHTYYIHATPNSEHDYTINSSSVHKMKANYDGTIYNLHDASVYFDN